MVGHGFEEERTAEEFGAFANAEESEVSVALGFGHALRGEGAAVVTDLEMHGAVVLHQGKPGLRGGGVVLDILEGFLGEAEKVGEVFAVEKVDRIGFDPDFQRDAGALTEGVGVPLECGRETEMVEEGGAKVTRESADVVEGALE